MRRASSRSASSSGVSAKSISARPRHAEAGHRDDVALHLVGAAAEGEDERGAVHALDAPLEHRPGRACLQRPRLAHHLEQQLIGLHVELAAVHLDRGGLGVVERAAGHAPRLLPVEEPEHLEPGPHARQVELHPGAVDHALAGGEPRGARPGACILEDTIQVAARRERDALVIQLRRDEPPAAVLRPYQVLRRNAYVLVVGGVGAHVAHRPDGRDLVARRAGGDDEHADALVLGRVGIGACGEPDVIGELGLAGEELGAVHDPRVAVAHGARAERGQIGAGGRLGVTDREVALAAQDGGQEARLLRPRPVLHDGRGDGVDGERREHDPGARRLVEEDELLDRRAALAAVLARPADAEPAVGAEPPDRLQVERPATLGPGQLGLVLGRHQAREVRAQLLAQRLLLGGAVEADVASGASVAAAVERVHAALGPVHVLVNDAGIAGLVPLEEMTEDQWDRMIAVHLKGAFNCTRAVLGDMTAAGWGRIVNVSSVAGLSGAPNLVHYSAAKAGLIGFTKALAGEVGPRGITVNAIAPGLIDTPMLQRSGWPDSLTQIIVAQNPIKRIGTPEDIAAACAYLVSEEASYVTGQVLSPNGGGRL